MIKYPPPKSYLTLKLYNLNKLQKDVCKKKRKSPVDPLVKGFNNTVTYMERISNKIDKGVEREDHLDNKQENTSSVISKM